MSSGPLPPHSEKLLLVSCFDGRLVGANVAAISEGGGGFPLLVGGGGLAVLHPESREYLLGQVKLAQAVHAHPLIILRAHIACGYAGVYQAVLGCSDQSSPAELYERLEQAAALIRTALGPDSTVKIKLEVVEPTDEGAVVQAGFATA